MGARIEMPKYKSHKDVWALKIKHVEVTNSDGGGFLSFEEEEYADKVMSPEYMAKHTPKSGGYLVIYKGGYESFSPADAFEEGYSQEARISNDSADINEFEREILDIINRSSSHIPLVTTYGVLRLIAQDLINKASMARVMLSAGEE